ncbi:MAG: hypothetical protein U1E27_02135, partial [Kiritimatiellia bacterium]|nr:hypothetical protein [Kiritimatiellia bacterium]
RLLRGESFPGANTNNSRRRMFLEVKDNQIKKTDGAYAFLDPWGNPYRYMLDFNYDDAVTVGEFSTNLISRRSAVWSRGPEKNGTYPEPIISW